jgi:hypothetical protein
MSMKYEEFQVTVIELASQGTVLTVANVVALTRLEPAQVEGWLDQMTREGRLEIEVDDPSAAVCYRVPGLTVRPPRFWQPSRAAGVRPPRKSTAVGVLAGLLVPGFGLLYAAPLSVAAIAGVVVLLGVKMLGAVPLLGGLLASIALGIGALGSGLLAVAYVRQYNRVGRRSHLPAPADGDWPRHAATAIMER